MANTDKKAAPAGKPIVDVAHPGKSAPSANSKSVIVQNRPIMNDPMMAKAATDNDTQPDLNGSTTETAGKSSFKKPQLAPLAAVNKADTSEPESKPAENDEPKKAESEPAASDGTGDDQNSIPDEAAPVDVAADETIKQAEHDIKIQKLVDDKEYFLPINAVEKRRTKRFVALGVVSSLVLMLAWVNIVLDAGLIQTDANIPHTHYFDTATAASEPAAETVTYRNYTTPISKLHFRYPATWKVTPISLATTDEKTDDLSVDPKPNTEKFTDGTVSVFLTPNPDSNANSSATVRTEKYQKLAQPIFGKQLYLDEVIYETVDGRFFVSASLSGEKTDTVGKPWSSHDFVDAKGTPIQFGIIVYAGEDALGQQNKVGFDTLKDAQDFQKAVSYQKARAILLSARSTKP